MGLYSKYIFPRLLDRLLSTAELEQLRPRALAPAQGNVLEIGFGTGLNLPYYPATVTQLTALDSEQMLRAQVARRIAAAQFPVHQFQLDAATRLPFADQQFDTVVTTLTLCSIANVAAALAEIRRVLKPTGRFVFLEHGRSAEPKVARRQDRYNPIHKFIAGGCHVNRPIDRLITAAGLELVTLERFLLTGAPRVLGEMYQGVAQVRNP